MGRNLVEVYITEEYRASVKGVLDNALQGSEAANFEFPLFTKDQKRVEVLLNATTRRDVSGNVVGVIGVGQDVTERKLAELEMTRVAKELQTFIDTANAPIFGIDSSGLVNEWNNMAAQITGFTRDEVMGHVSVRLWAAYGGDGGAQSCASTAASTAVMRCTDSTNACVWARFLPPIATLPRTTPTARAQSAGAGER